MKTKKMQLLREGVDEMAVELYKQMHRTEFKETASKKPKIPSLN